MDSEIIILGMGISGEAALKKLYRQGERHFLVIDKKPLPYSFKEAHVRFLLDQKELKSSDFQRAKRVVLSPGVGPTSTAYQLVRQLAIPLIGEMELGLEGLKGRKVILTGSNGKSTCVTLIAHLLREAGYLAQAVGNIGVPLCSIEESSDEQIWIVEASSYQLETLEAKVFDAAALINICENHLDRYGEMEAYIAAKARIQEVLKPDATLWIEPRALDLARSFLYWHKLQLVDDLFTKESKGSHYLTKLFALNNETNYKQELSHDIENVKVALAICESLGLNLEQACKGLSSYQKLAHRMENVGEYKGVKFINDSKSSNVESTLHALEALEGPLVLLAGGVHKGSSYAPWRNVLKTKGLGVCVMGQSKEIIANDLEGCCPIYLCDSLRQLLERAWGILQARSADGGANLLFSPGCASFDMFKNFEDRGDRFKESVQAIKAGGLDDTQRHNN